MSRYFSIPVFALTAIVAGCGRSDRPQTTSTSAGANTPVVSGTSSVNDTGGETPVVVAPVTYERAESVYGTGNYGEATQLFGSYTESNPENPWGHYMLGLAAWKNGEPDRAISAFDRSLQLDPTHRKSLYNSGRVLLELGRSQEALERIQKALAQDPSSNEGLRLLGRAQYRLGKVDDAIKAYQQALAADHRDVWSMNNLGLIYIEQERAREALPPLARAVQLRNTAPVFQNNLGVALERSGYPVAAAKAYEAAIAVDSTYQKATVGLARVTAGGQQIESEAVDLSSLAEQFLSEIESWQESVPANDSTVVSASDSAVPLNDPTATDSTLQGDSTVPVSDSTVPAVDSIMVGQERAE
jgi:tetratricopeptide (TPR) repeat protein